MVEVDRLQPGLLQTTSNGINKEPLSARRRRPRRAGVGPRVQPRGHRDLSDDIWRAAARRAGFEVPIPPPVLQRRGHLASASATSQDRHPLLSSVRPLLRRIDGVSDSAARCPGWFGDDVHRRLQDETGLDWELVPLLESLAEEHMVELHIGQVRLRDGNNMYHQVAMMRTQR